MNTMNTLKKSIYSFSCLILLSFSSCLKVEASDQEECDVVAKVYNIGQGNCVVLKVKEKDELKPSYMLIDAGTTSFANEILYNLHQSPVKNNSKAPDSITKASDFHRIVNKSTGKDEKNSKSAKDIKSDAAEEVKDHQKKMIQKMRKMFGAEEPKDPVRLKTLIITHPDVDHYNWIFRIFSNPKDKIKYIIFGGLPQVYASKQIGKKFPFKNWIETRIKKGSQVFFPAIQYEAITSLEDVIEKEKNYFYAPHSYTPVEEKWPKKMEKTVRHLQPAIDFGEKVKIFFLSINPTHFVGESGRIIRFSESKDDNRDSLVLKISYGKSSIILTGDATGATTTRIMDNYCYNKGHLETQYLLASHHASSTHDSNSLTSLKSNLPECVLISNGHKQGHPDAQAYENFKQLTSLKMVTRHRVLVGKLNNVNQGLLHETSRAIFSTLNSGTLTVTLHQDGKFDLFTGKNGEIQICDPQEAIQEDRVEEVEIQEKEGSVTFSAQKNVKSKSKIEQSKKSRPVMKSLKEKKVSKTDMDIDQDQTPIVSKTKAKLKKETKGKKTIEKQKNYSDSDEKNVSKKSKKRKIDPSPFKINKKNKQDEREKKEKKSDEEE